MMTPAQRKRRAISPAMVVVPSLVSGLGVACLLVAFLANNQILQDVFLCLGAVLLWVDFFVTMAIFRSTVRHIDGRLQSIEERVAGEAQDP